MENGEHDRGRVEAAAVEALVLAVVVAPVLLFGGKADLYAAPVDFLGIALLGLTLWRRLQHGPARPVSRHKSTYFEPWPALALLGGYAALHGLQLMPLPAAVVAALTGWRPETAWAPLSPNPEATIRALLSWLPAMAAFAAVTLLYDQRAQLRRLLLAIFLLAAVTSLYGIMEVAGGNEMIWTLPKLVYRGSVTGTFVNRNNFAAFVALGLGAGLALGLHRRSKTKEVDRGTGQLARGARERVVIFLFLGVVCLLGALLSRSRGGMGGIVLAGLPTAWLMLGERRKAMAPIFAAALVVTVLMGLWVSREPLTERFAQLPGEAAAVGARPAAWWNSARLALRSQPFGLGAGAFADRFRLIPGTGILVIYNHVHCDPLEALVETGVVGFAALFGAILWTLAAAVRGFRERHSRFARALAIGGLAGVIAVLAHSMVDFPLQTPGVRNAFFAMLGVAYLAANRRLTR